METFFESPAMLIGKHEWRVIVYSYDGAARFTRYEWRRVPTMAGLPPARWRSQGEWRSYNMNHTNGGMPASLKTLYLRYEADIQRALNSGTASAA